MEVATPNILERGFAHRLQIKPFLALLEGDLAVIGHFSCHHNERYRQSTTADGEKMHIRLSARCANRGFGILGCATAWAVAPEHHCSTFHVNGLVETISD